MNHQDHVRPFAITERTYRFACEIVQARASMEKRSWVARTVGSQLLRAGTSIGANVEEAQGAFGRRDFINRNVIALKEARETRYWLRLLRDSGMLPSSQAEQLCDEAGQLCRILGSIVSRSRGL
jgi:four helix bundle protein